MLHVLVSSPFKIDCNLTLSMLNPLDSFIGIQDGVFIGLVNNVFIKDFLKFSFKLYLLKEDVIARGITSYISDQFHLINYAQFIVLTEKYQKVLNW
ncbi:Protein TusB [Buchnera aphidicola (Phyllaphis fagi)]|uniref:sulfurtransferase complex subunit TusB n=1 Tax=Buchnera aphidicola TaxID=9 RepID=UPI003464AE51